MSKDDMDVIVYKILRYLDRCMKNGKKPDLADYCYNSSIVSIPESYWNNVMIELNDNGLVKGVYYEITKDGPLVSCSDIQITLQGTQFLRDNSGMQKAKKFLGPAFEIVIDALL